MTWPFHIEQKIFKWIKKIAYRSDPEQFCAIQSNPVLSQEILCYLEESCAFLSNLVLSWPILYYPAWEILYCPVLSWAILCYIVQSSAIPRNPVLSHTILSYPSLHTNTTTSYPIYTCNQHIMTPKSQVWQTDRWTGILTTREALAS